MNTPWITNMCCL